MRKYTTAIVCASFFFAFGVATLSHYGINWDEPHRLMRGQAYLHYFLTGKTSYGYPGRLPPNFITPGSYVSRYDMEAAEQDDHPAILPDRPLPQTEYRALGLTTSYFAHDAWNGKYFLAYDRNEIAHLPLPELLAAISNKIFFQWLGVLGDIESSHLPYIFISALGVFFAASLTLDITKSRFASLVAGLSLGLFPLFWAEAHFNLKDPLVSALFAGSIWSLFRFVKTNRTIWFVLLCTLIAFSLGIKWNIVFLPFIIVPWLFTIRKTSEFKRFWQPRKLFLAGTIGAIAILTFLILIYPTSWQAPIAAFIDVGRSYIGMGTGGKSIEPPGFFFFGINLYPITLLFSQTPEIILILVGSALILRRVPLLMLLWLLIPILRYSLPPARVYSGIRQIMEVLPAIAVMAGIGAGSISKKPLLKILIILLFLPLVYKIIQIHPNENAYFNSFANKKSLADIFITHGNVYRQGADWLNEHAEKDANVALLDGRTLSLTPLFLRSDISISPYHFSGFERKGEYIAALQSPTERAIFSYEYARRFLTPIYEITVDGIPILSIYKNDEEHLRLEFSREHTLAPDDFRVVGSGERRFIEINLGRERKVTQIIVSQVPSGCYVPNHYADVDSLITFLPSEHIFGLNERKGDNLGNVTYYFPAEPAQRIRITPIGENSCFTGGVITGVTVLAP